MPARFLIGLVLGFPALAGYIQVWQIEDTARAPVLVVGRVLARTEGEAIPQAEVPWRLPVRYDYADIQVLRSWQSGEHSENLDGAVIRLRFVTYNKILAGSAGDPIFPALDPGDVFVFPLRQRHVQEPWRLVQDQGVGLLLPATGAVIDGQTAVSAARQFLFRELASALAVGTSREVSRAAMYAGFQRSSLRRELMPMLENAIGSDTQRWAAIATSLLTYMGEKRPTIGQLRAGTSSAPLGRNYDLASGVFGKLDEGPATRLLLVRTLISNTASNFWGTAEALKEFAQDPVLAGEMREALRKETPGSAYLAWTLIRDGQTALAPEALAFAMKEIDRPVDHSELVGACSLIRDYGSDAQFRTLLSVIRKYRSRDREHYKTLSAYASHAARPRNLAVFAILLEDKGIKYGDIRYCDTAVREIERVSQRSFGPAEGNLAERDTAVASARAWLVSQGVQLGLK